MADDSSASKVPEEQKSDSDGKTRLPVVAPGAQLTKPPTGNVIAQAWLVLVLAVAFGSGLAGLQYAVGPRIAENKLNETLSQVPSLVPGAVNGAPDDQVLSGRRVFRALDGEGKLVGWVVPGNGQGFGDKIELIIGLNAAATELTGIFVLDQKETPALGDRITTSEFQSRFVGMSTDRTLDAQQAPTDPATGVIQALSGATISSDAVCSIINRTLKVVQAPLAAAAQGASAGAE
jgi:electron transport complex protein RnfG